VPPHWATILSLLTSGRVKPIVERTYKLAAAEALRHLIEDRPFGRVVSLTARQALRMIE
jgi:NADPH2:quinone reductase